MTMHAIPSHPVICLHPHDHVVIARATLLPGAPVADGITAFERIPAGHKVAVRPLAAGEAVRRYNQIIGFATASIAPGQHVHVHNLGMGEFTKDYAYSQDARPTEYVDTPVTFEGIHRPDGRVATRNYIGILTSVNCSAHAANLVADAFKRHPFTGFDPLAEFPNVDGVVALTHKTGCGMPEGEPLQLLRRTLAGYARHPNFSHIVVLGRFTFRGRARTRFYLLFGSSAGLLWSGFDPGENALHILIRRRLQPRIGGSCSVVITEHFGDSFRINLLGLDEQTISLLIMADCLFMQALFR